MLSRHLHHFNTSFRNYQYISLPFTFNTWDASFWEKKTPQNAHILGVILIRPSVHFWNLLHVPFLYFPFSLMDYFFKWKRSREKLPTILGTLWRPPFVFWGDKRKHGTWNKEQKVSLTCSRKVKVELWSRHRVRESLGRERTLGFPLERHQSVL